jgi:hypothetical protein
MDFGRVAMDPGVAARHLAARLEEAGLPRFVSAEHDAELDLLKLSWAHRVTLYMDLRRDDIVEPIGRLEVVRPRGCRVTAAEPGPRSRRRVGHGCVRA